MARVQNVQRPVAALEWTAEKSLSEGKESEGVRTRHVGNGIYAGS